MKRYLVMGVIGEVDKGNGVMNEGDKSSTTHVSRTVLTDRGIVWEGVGWQIFG